MTEPATTVTRFAPSPTGYMHIGNLRTALYAFLLARARHGKFILRIEDTDQNRLVDDAVRVIIDTLKAADLNYDEGPEVGGDKGPYYQSQRLEIYRKYAEQLLASGHAYPCFCDKERIDSLRTSEDAVGGYDRHCRNIPVDEAARRMAAGETYVLRHKAPLDGVSSYEDVVFGAVSVECKEMKDFILLKSDGFPTYNFAHVVDDHLMGVTHVVRGSEYVTSTPQYVLLYEALGWPRPTYVHLPLIMGRNEDGSISKLSKRHGAVSFQDLVNEGYLPQAILNYIAFLGWTPKSEETEIFSLTELAEQFRIEDIHKSPAVFDYAKLRWFNGNYIRNLSAEAFGEMAASRFGEGHTLEGAAFAKLIALLQTRVEILSQIPEMVGFFFELGPVDTALFENKKNKSNLERAKIALTGAAEVLEKAEWTGDALFAALKAFAQGATIPMNAVIWAVRIALSGQPTTPGGATDIMEVLGREESVRRVRAALAQLNA